MPPKKKKQPKNAFLFFMLDWKKEKEEMGFTFPGGLKEVSERCNDDWLNLPPQMAERYKEKAKEAKEQDKSDLANKYTSLGKSYKELYREKHEEQAAMESMMAEIKYTLQNISRTPAALKSHRFYLIHANWYCYYREENLYIPCEVAISEFTLAEGLMRTLHIFPSIVYPVRGKIPMGYMSDVLDHKTKTHNIPFPDPPNAEKDYAELDRKIRSFLLPTGGSELPPLYTMEDNGNTFTSMSTVKNFFENIARENRTDNEFRVYTLPILFKLLLDTCVEMSVKIDPDSTEVGLDTLALATAQLERDVYNFTSGLACEFHEGDESMQYCSLSWVKRWVFLICYFCCRSLKIEFTPGKHCPKSAETPSYSNPAPKQINPTPQPSQSLGAIPRRYGTEHRGLDSVSQGVESLRIKDRSTKESRSNTRHAAPQEITIIDHSKVVDPSTLRIYKVGQSPNIVSEVMPEGQEEFKALRTPKGPGRGEMLASLLQRVQETAPSFNNQDFPSLGGRGNITSKEDFPALGSPAPAPGRLSKPIVSAWGRGFTPRQDSGN